RESAVRLGATLLAALVLLSARAGAQTDFMGPGINPMGPPPSTKPSKKKAPPPGTPETHAASGASESLVPPGSEPSLPEKPLEIKKKVNARIGSDSAVDEPEVGRASTTTLS